MRALALRFVLRANLVPHLESEMWSNRLILLSISYMECSNMAMPVLPPAQITQLSGLVAAYIAAQRAIYFPAAEPLSVKQKAAMAGFFAPEVLNETRLTVLVDRRVANPDFYPMLRAMGFTNLPDEASMAAITFSDTVVAHQAFDDVLLFHELVHVEQYRQLGIPKFADLYVRGFLSGGGYEGIPLERNAYELEHRYESAPAVRFSVAEVVTDLISGGRF
jgi:hypothetical protein